MKFRFGLRTLLMVVTAFGAVFTGGMIWHSSQLREYQRQAKIADQLSKHGIVTWEQKTPPWLEWTGSSKAFLRITAIDCDGSADTIRVMSLAEQLPTLTSVRLFYDEKILEEHLIDELLKLKNLKTFVIKYMMPAGGPKSAQASIDRQAAGHEFTRDLRIRAPQLLVQEDVLYMW